MLIYLTGEELKDHPLLRDTMFEDRAFQFRQRLGWDVRVDRDGFERDEYDRLDAIYAIWVLDDGTHGGSMRTMPTNSDCMVNDHFSHVAGRKISDPLIWESTRFCVSPRARDDAFQISAALMLAGCEIGLGLGLQRAVAVFDQRVARIYRRLGWPPIILGSDGVGRDKISVGLWDFSEMTRARLAKAANVTLTQSKTWFANSFSELQRGAA